MIKINSFSKEWILTLRSSKNKIDPGLCEKMILALGLLELLALQKFDFVFRGGTSLILLIEEPQRFSIDIDINTEISKNDLENILNHIPGTIFSRFEEHVRKGNSIPKAHYKFFFQSVVNSREDYILLDVLFHKHSYPVTVQTPIRSFWIDTEEDIVNVNTPTLESILGDKLTAFAPNTTGVPYKASKSMEIIKQLFDIGRSFDLVNDFSIVRDSFLSVVSQEISFRENSFSYEDVLIDIIETSLMISYFPNSNTGNEEKTRELLSGLKSFSTFPIVYNYRVIEMIISAAKAAYLATKILKEHNTNLQQYNKRTDVESYVFPEKYKHLGKLKRANPEAYFYWMQVFEINSDFMSNL